MSFYADVFNLRPRVAPLYSISFSSTVYVSQYRSLTAEEEEESFL